MVFLAGVVAFIAEFLDSSLGMGYGTILAPILIIMGYSPLSVIPAILISQLVTDVTACICHHNCCNVDFRISSGDFKTASLLGLISSAGVVISAILASKIPQQMIAFFIGVVVFSIGALIIFSVYRKIHFSWPKIIGVSFLAAFNKGISGGGYGPLVMGGQILSGVNAKNAVGITAFAEAATCLVGFMAYLIIGKPIDWRLTVFLIFSAAMAVPLAALTVKKIPVIKLKKYIGILIMILGLMTIFKIAKG